jgi:hypothetical protein
LRLASRLRCPISEHGLGDLRILYQQGSQAGEKEKEIEKTCRKI